MTVYTAFIVFRLQTKVNITLVSIPNNLRKKKKSYEMWLLQSKNKYYTIIRVLINILNIEDEYGSFPEKLLQWARRSMAFKCSESRLDAALTPT